MGREVWTQLKGMCVDGEGSGGWGLWKPCGGGLQAPRGPSTGGAAQAGRGGGGDAGGQAAGPHRSTTKVEALWLTEAECSAHRPLGSSRVWTV